MSSNYVVSSLPNNLAVSQFGNFTIDTLDNIYFLSSDATSIFLVTSSGNSSVVRSIQDTPIAQGLEAQMQFEMSNTDPEATFNPLLSYFYGSGVDSSGNIYILSGNINNPTNLETPTGNVTLSGSFIFRIMDLCMLNIDNNGFVYIVHNSCIYKVNSSGVFSLHYNYQYSRIRNICFDSANNMYTLLKDYSNIFFIYKLDTSGTNSQLTDLRNLTVYPNYFAIDTLGNLYITHGASILMSNSTVNDIVIAGDTYTPGYVDGLGDVAKFSNLEGIIVNSLGEIIVNDSSNGKLRKITLRKIPTTLTLTASSSTANILTDVIITATVLDQNGIPMPSETVTLSNQLSSTPGLGAEMTSIGDGTYTYTVTDQYLETETYTAVVSSISNSVNVSWTFPPGVPSTIFVSASSQTAVIGTNVTFIASVVDYYSTPVPSFAVYIGDDSGSYTMTDLGNGTYSYTTNNTSFSTVGPVTYTVSISSLTDTTTVTWSEAGGGGGGNETPVATTLTFSPSSPTAIVGTNVTLTATVRDQNNNPFPGQSIFLYNTGSSTPGLGATMTSIGGGNYTYTVTDSVAETVTYTVSLDSLTDTTTVTWTSAGGEPPVATTITVIASSPTAVVGTNVTLTATVLDQNGNPMPNEYVFLSSSGTSSPGPESLMSVVGDGTYTYIVTDPVVETATYYINLGSLNETTTINWTPAGTPSITLVASPNPVYSGRATTLTVTLLDANGNGVVDSNVLLSSDNNIMLLGSSDPVNMSDIGGGVYTFQSTYTLTLTVIQSETFLFTATSSLFQINSTVSVIWKPIPTSIVLSPGNILQPLPTGSGTGITAYVTREDTPISGETVTLSSTQGTVLMNGDGPGTYSSLVTSNSPGTITYTASISAVPLSSNTFNITWANPTNPLSAPCFLEGTKILCQVGGLDTYIPVEKLTTETLVKTCLNGYKKVVLIGTGPIENPGNDERVEQRLYKLSPSKYSELNEDLFITGCHSRLVRELTDKEREETVKHVKRIFVTDKQYRLMACIDEKAEPWNSKGKYTIWHFALEHENVKMNYGVYANGLLVETCSINTLQNKSNFTLIK